MADLNPIFYSKKHYVLYEYANVFLPPLTGVTGDTDLSRGTGVVTGQTAGIFKFDASLSTNFYLLTLTGPTDIEIPMSSFQGRLRSGEQSYLSAVIPYTDDYADAITARPNGDIKVDMAYEIDGEFVQRETIAWAHLDNIRLDIGSKNASITLSGYRQETYTQKTVILKDPTYYMLSDGKKTYRFANPNMDLNPGDTVTIGDDSLIADLITYIIGTNTQQMEIAEQ